MHDNNRGNPPLHLHRPPPLETFLVLVISVRPWKSTEDHRRNPWLYLIRGFGPTMGPEPFSPLSARTVTLNRHFGCVKKDWNWIRSIRMNANNRTNHFLAEPMAPLLLLLHFIIISLLCSIAKVHASELKRNSHQSNQSSLGISCVDHGISYYLSSIHFVESSLDDVDDAGCSLAKKRSEVNILLLNFNKLRPSEGDINFYWNGWKRRFGWEHPIVEGIGKDSIFINIRSYIFKCLMKLIINYYNNLFKNGLFGAYLVIKSFLHFNQQINCQKLLRLN